MFLSEIHPNVRKELHRREFILKRLPKEKEKIRQSEILDPKKENRDLLAESFAKSPWVRVFSPLNSQEVISNPWKRALQIKRMTLPEFGQSNRYFKGGDKAKVWEDFKNGIGHDGGKKLIPNPEGYDTVLLQSGLMDRDSFDTPETLTADGKTWSNKNKIYTGFNGVYGRDKKSEDPISTKNNKGDKYKSFTGHGVMPIPGVKNISISYTGEMKASREATIEWVCWSFKDLQLLTPHFLEMGKLVVLEWGWGGLGGANKPIPLDYNRISNAARPADLNKPEGRNNMVSLHDEIQDNVFENGGNYDAMVGVISNFEWSLRSDGGFDCTTTLKSRGVNIINQALGSPSNTTGIKLGGTEGEGEGEVEDTSPQLTFDKFMDQMLLQIKEITNTMQFESNNLKKYWENQKTNPGWQSKKEFVTFMREATVDKTAWQDDLISDGIFWPAGWGLINDEELGPWLSWGWIEDNVLSRFLGKVDIHGNLIQEFRSVDAVYRGKQFIGYEPTKISNHRELITVDPEICIIPGQYPLHISEWEGKWTSDDPWGFMAKFVDDKEGNTPFTPAPFRAYRWQKTNWGWQHPSKTGFDWTAGSDQYEYGEGKHIKKGAQYPARPGEYLQILHVARQTPWESIREAGYMRHLLIHHQTFKDAFEGVDSVEAACQSLFNKLNSTTGIWDLHLTTDGERVKVVDRNYTEEKVKDLLTEPSVWGTVNKNTGVVTEYGAKELKDDKILPNGKVYIFPSWERNSMVKSQTLTAKFPEGAAVTAMYGGVAAPGANPSEGSGNPADFLASSELQSTIDPTQPNVSGAWEKRYGRDGTFGTKYPYNLTIAKGNWENFGVGNGFDFDISNVSGVNTSAPGNAAVEAVNTAVFLREGLITNLQSIYQANGEYTKANSGKYFIDMELFEGSIKEYHETGKGSIKKLRSAPAYQKKASDTIVEIYDKKTGKLKNNSPHAYVDAMKYLIGVDRVKSIFGVGGSSPMLKMELELEIQGIGGIVPGNVFSVSLLPDTYKGKVVFQATNVDQELSDTGWKTTLTGQMRVNISDQGVEPASQFITPNFDYEWNKNQERPLNLRDPLVKKPSMT